jgi:homoserine dehydrogenase
MTEKRNEIGVAVLGFGTVGAGVVEILLAQDGLLAERLGVRVALRAVCDLDLDTDRGVKVPDGILSRDSAAAVARDDVDVVVETIGGCGVARALVLDALRRGKAVVTANKKLIAEHGKELFETARANGARLHFEASVGGGIPILKALTEGLVANRILRIEGILNGTCNYILTRMESEGLAFDPVLRAAQEAGYAEAEPSLDIDGHDTAHKAAILASLACGKLVEAKDVAVRGIRGIDARDIRYAGDLGYRIKLLAHMACGEEGLEVSVAPTLVGREHLLSQVSGVFNAVLVEGDSVGTTLFYGRGAGRAATASAVVADIADAAEALARGGAWRYERLPEAGEIARRPRGEEESRHYLRFSLRDTPGALARVAQTLGAHGIGIASVIQKESEEGAKYVPVVMVTGKVKAAALEEALATIAADGDWTEGETVSYPING